MLEGPRPKKESIIEKVMTTGIVIQTCTLTTCCLLTYVIGLKWFVGAYDGTYDNPWPSESLESKIIVAEANENVSKAKTMSILFIVFAE